MTSFARSAVIVGCATTLLFTLGCTDKCDPETIDKAVAFLDSHQSCETDEDCTTVSDFCEELPGGFCGQLAMSKEGAESSEWKALEQELGDCGPDECTVCNAELIPSCGNGSCRGTEK
jgi:hypothetical protein